MGALTLTLHPHAGRYPFPPGRAARLERPSQAQPRRARALGMGWLAELFDAATDAASDPAGRRDEAFETQLVAAAKYGDPDAFDRLVTRHAPALHAVARRLVGDDLASDVVQDSLLAAYRSLQRFRGEASFGSYLHGIVVNRCRRVAPRWRRPTAPAEMLAAEASREPGPEARAVASDTRDRIEAALRSLPVRYREALALREFGGLSYEEIAEAVAVPVGTVRSRIARARGLVREELVRLGVQP